MTGPFPAPASTAARSRACTCAARPRIPGGNVTGLPGYNSAQVLLADLGLAEFRPGH